MGKIYEALERAERQYQVPPPRSDHQVQSLPELASKHELRAPATEQFEAIKTGVGRQLALNEPRTIAFCSTAKGSGVSTTCMYYAASLARNPKRKVLLVDANVRSPSLHTMLRVRNETGITDYLLHAESTLPAVITLSSKNFFLLPVGRQRNGVVSLFDSESFDHFVETMRQNFDHVVFDCPPLTPFSETRLICSKVDGVILVLHSGKTKRQVALRAKKSLQDAGATILGVVLNKRKYYIPRWLYDKL